MRHGDAARGAFILREGSAEARIPAPGGEHYVIARLAGGDIFGEMALVDAGTCTATVVATANIDSGWFLAFEDFRAVVSRAPPGVARVAGCGDARRSRERLRAVNAKLAAIASPEDRPARQVPAQPRAGIARPLRAPFDLGLSCLASLSSSVSPRKRSTSSRPRRGSSRPPAARCCTRRAARRKRSTSSPEVPSSRSCVPSMAVSVASPSSVRESCSGSSRRTARGARRTAPTPGCARSLDAALETPLWLPHPLFLEAPCASRLRGAVQRSLLESLGRTNRALTRFAAHARLATPARGCAVRGCRLRPRRLPGRRLVPGYFVDGDFARDPAQCNLLRDGLVPGITEHPRRRGWSTTGAGRGYLAPRRQAPARAPRC